MGATNGATGTSEGKLFTAIRIPKPQADCIAALVPPTFPGENRIAPENYHITLEFLGPSSEERIARHIRRLSNARIQTRPFPVVLGKIGFFRASGVVYLAPTHVSGVANLYEETCRVLGTIPRPTYRPHVTLAKGLSFERTNELSAQLQITAAMVEINVSRIHLIESKNIDGKTVYTSRFSLELGAPCPTYP